MKKNPLYETIVPSPRIEEDFALRGKQKSEHKYTNIAGSAVALMKPALKLTTGLSLTNTASSVILGYELMKVDPTVSTLVGVASGALAFAIYKSAKSVEPKFNNMLSDNIYKDIGNKHQYEYKSGDTDPRKSYTEAIVKECARRNARLMWHKAGKLPRFIKETHTLMVDKFFNKEHERLYLGFAQNDSDGRSLFLAHVMGLLQNSNDPVAQRIKMEPVFDRETIKSYMEDAGRMVKDMAKILPDIKSVSKTLEKSMGSDVRFLVDNLDSYSRGRESYFALELDILEHATQQSQIEGVAREFSTRLVNSMIRGVNGEITKDNIDQEISRFNEFESLFGRYKNDPQLLTLASNGVRTAKKMLTSIGKTNGRQTAKELNETLTKTGIISSNLSFKKMEQGSPEHSRAVDAIMRTYLGKDKDLTLSFQEQMLTSTMHIIEKRVKEKTKINFPSAEALEKVDLGKLDFEKINTSNLSEFQEYLTTLSDSEFSHTKGQYDKSSTTLEKVAIKFREYGIRSLEAASPDDAAKAVFDRIKARLYYETHKPEMKKAYERMGFEDGRDGFSF